MTGWQVSEASETLSGVYKFKLVRYVYIYIYIYVWRYVCHNSSACYAYVMWAELDHCHFLYVPAVLQVVTTGNGTGTKNILKWNRELGFEFSILSSVYGAKCSESKPILYLDTVYCKFFILCKRRH